MTKISINQVNGKIEFDDTDIMTDIETFNFSNDENQAISENLENEINEYFNAI